MQRAYYSATQREFLATSPDTILGTLTRNHPFALEDLQKNAWLAQIHILQEQLPSLPDSYVAFEYAIPRMGKRVDVVILHSGVVFVLEFKVGEKTHTQHSVIQALDYALDLKNFHEKSHTLPIVPMVIATESAVTNASLEQYKDGVCFPIKANKSNIAAWILNISNTQRKRDINPIEWCNSIYKPTPTIIEAAQALYKGHSVREISRSDSGAINLNRTSTAVAEIIEHSKKHSKKSICFITGVPGAGKTLAGLTLANDRNNADKGEHAVFLSGNGPLVEVLQEALARNEVAENKNTTNNISKRVALSKVKSFIQNIHHFRDDNLRSTEAPIEKVTIFDEAQRAWTAEQAASFMTRKKGISDFTMSEPEFLISVLDRHQDWATIVCLIGGGQEINTGEAGLPEWFSAINNKYPHWDVYTSGSLSGREYTNGENLYASLRPDQLTIKDELHLAVSIRSFRSELLSEFIGSVLDLNQAKATALFTKVQKTYPIVLTRHLQHAKQWLKTHARGGEQFGLTAYSGALRLKPEGIHVKTKIDPKNWFLNGPEDVRSSMFLEDVATEFDIQGLELDWTCVAWDSSLRLHNKEWEYRTFRGTTWQNVNDEIRRRYLLNAYRVLLTRARQGMVIFIPKGNPADQTRLPEFYAPVYEFFSSCGVPSID
ncbi:DUF2075 domain-containing protein [Halodesulfovibrio marinisediminis]|uniref:Uncharacterized conserved protein n=1 Tax=Halodesulfovibrio marinisediminis DSM 17456 TaxID=1121457 RepID=A0A1N6J937_9BACT|nr:DUF2075 domain-containing protein [Halodesulfovibrio marinisediminis]SIO40792.1 Uncharacterized conserved protein [Halodesulfovibrio marinisediminis DSM 17456]